MPTARPDTYDIASGADLWAGVDEPPASVSPMDPAELVANGVWTWFNEPRAIYDSGVTYIGWITSGGSVGVTSFTHADESLSSFTLRASMETDDHDNPALYMRSDGKLLAAYAKHSTDGFGRYRIATNAGSIAAWDAEQTLSDSFVGYANLHYLTDSDLLYWHYRSGNTATRPRKGWASDDEGSSWGAGSNWINQTSQRPYTKTCNNGSRVDMVVTTGHPNEAATSIYHAYMEPSGGSLQFYESDGTLIGASMAPADGTLIYDGSSVDGWVWDITYGADGHPWVLFARYPSTTDHRYMFSRWTGSAWTTPVEICAAGTYLYAAEAYYSGGLCFDGNDPTRVFVSVQDGSAWEVQEYRTDDDGATWSKYRDITSGSGSVKNCRPWSPRGHDNKLAVLWWRGTYTTYTNYSTAIWGAG